MSAGYGNNPYVLNIVPLFGVAGSASGSAGSASGLGTTDGASANAATQVLATNTIGTLDSGSVQFTSAVLIDVGGVVIQLQAKIEELEARIVA